MNGDKKPAVFFYMKDGSPDFDVSDDFLKLPDGDQANFIEDAIRELRLYADELMASQADQDASAPQGID